MANLQDGQETENHVKPHQKETIRKILQKKIPQDKGAPVLQRQLQRAYRRELWAGLPGKFEAEGSNCRKIWTLKSALVTQHDTVFKKKDTVGQAEWLRE